MYVKFTHRNGFAWAREASLIGLAGDLLWAWRYHCRLSLHLRLPNLD
jgi:hypothetical protein